MDERETKLPRGWSPRSGQHATTQLLDRILSDLCGAPEDRPFACKNSEFCSLAYMPWTGVSHVSRNEPAGLRCSRRGAASFVLKLLAQYYGSSPRTPVTP